jgi:hypothetical protein
MSDACFEVGEKRFPHECAESFTKLRDAGNGVSLLPFVVGKLGSSGLRIGWNGSPEFIAAKVAVGGGMVLV